MTALSLIASSSRSTISLLPRVPTYLHTKSARIALTSRILCLASSAASPSAPWYLSIPGVASLLELLPPIVLAVPKHKVTHSRKSMRSANKGLKNKSNFSQCEACGGVKLAHNICPSCYSQISRKWKSDARNSSGLSDASTPSS